MASAELAGEILRRAALTPHTGCGPARHRPAAKSCCSGSRGGWLGQSPQPDLVAGFAPAEREEVTVVRRDEDVCHRAAVNRPGNGFARAGVEHVDGIAAIVIVIGMPHGSPLIAGDKELAIAGTSKTGNRGCRSCRGIGEPEYLGPGPAGRNIQGSDEAPFSSHEQPISIRGEYESFCLFDTGPQFTVFASGGDIPHAETRAGHECGTVRRELHGPDPPVGTPSVPEPSRFNIDQADKLRRVIHNSHHAAARTKYRTAVSAEAVRRWNMELQLRGSRSKIPLLDSAVLLNPCHGAITAHRQSGHGIWYVDVVNRPAGCKIIQTEFSISGDQRRKSGIV